MGSPASVASFMILLGLLVSARVALTLRFESEDADDGAEANLSQREQSMSARSPDANLTAPRVWVDEGYYTCASPSSDVVWMRGKSLEALKKHCLDDPRCASASVPRIVFDDSSDRNGYFINGGGSHVCECPMTGSIYSYKAATATEKKDEVLSKMHGFWHYGAKYYYNVVGPWDKDKGECNFFFIGTLPDSAGKELRGDLVADGKWYVADLPNDHRVGLQPAGDKMNLRFRSSPASDYGKIFVAEVDGCPWYENYPNGCDCGLRGRTGAIEALDTKEVVELFEWCRDNCGATSSGRCRSL